VRPDVNVNASARIDEVAAEALREMVQRLLPGLVRAIGNTENFAA